MAEQLFTELGQVLLLENTFWKTAIEKEIKYSHHGFVAELSNAKLKLSFFHEFIKVENTTLKRMA